MSAHSEEGENDDKQKNKQEDTMTEALRQQAKQVFSRTPIWHMDMKESLNRGQGQVVYAQGNTVLVQEKDEPGFYRLTTDSAEEGLKAFAGQPEPFLVVMRGNGVEEIAQKLGFSLDNPCCQGAYLGTEKMEWSMEGLEIGVMTAEEVPLAASVYEAGEYLSEQAEKGLLFSARLHGQFAGFIGFHGDGSTGLLEVLPEFRRRGIGQCLEKYMINVCLDRGWINYGHIYTDNAASFALQESLGLTVDKEHVLYWAGKAPEML